MSWQPLRQTWEQASRRGAEWAGTLWEAWDDFRGSRLYAQTLIAAGLVTTAWLVLALPISPLSGLKAALVWTATHDYDFAGQARAVNRWAEQRGGWGRATADVWQQGIQDLQAWAGPWLQSPGSSSPEAVRPAAHRDLMAPGRQAFVMPVDGAVLHGFGWLPRAEAEVMHDGIDLLAEPGTPVVAVADGRVVRVTADARLGQMVEVEHGKLLALYAQVDRIRVAAGQRVRRGEPIAVVAEASGEERHLEPHLHFEVRPVANRQPVDPLLHLPIRGKEL